MLYPDAKQRMVLGWQIRWIAGLFCLLIVAAGAIPAYASDGVDPLLDSKSGALFATFNADHSERASGHDLGTATGTFLGSSSTWEPELEDDQADASTTTVAISLCIVRESRRSARHDEQAPRPAFEPGLLTPRAPPRA